MLTELFRWHVPSNPLLVGRIVKALLPSLSVLLSMNVIKTGPKTSESVSRKKAGKQKVNGFETDDTFKLSRDRLCGSEDEAQLMVAVLEGKQTHSRPISHFHINRFLTN